MHNHWSFHFSPGFPTIYSSPVVTVETVNNYSLLYGIKGSDSTLKPYLLCSHLDVVPVEADKWEVKPFSGSIKDGFIYGRGSIDVKNTLMVGFFCVAVVLDKEH